MTASEQLVEINVRLKDSNMGVKIELIGNRLYLRATLPPKPNSNRSRPFQQRIALGICANKKGVKRAESEAYKLGGLLACKEFRWDVYLQNSPDSPPVRYIANLIKDFENFYFETRQRNDKSETTWCVEYLRVFKRLPQNELLNKEAILQVVRNTQPDTRARKRVCMSLQALAQFAGIKIDLKAYKGTYSPKKATPRDLPTDAIIAKTYYEIKDDAWRWVYGMLAAYGLRNHEVFRLDLEALLNT